MQIKTWWLLLLCLLLFLTSCGYTLHKNIPLDSVRLGSIVNQTFEHGLEDKLMITLTEELMKNGIRVEKTSPYSIRGVIDTFELRGVAYKENVAVQFEVFIKGSFYLHQDVTEESPFELGGTVIFPITFSSEGTLEEITALKEEAIERALGELSSEIVSSILYR
ncbi:MAG: hypothetical protein HY805_06615 [Nitrospirae bacterium]|nr:hypothetical protein [Nitrospirota bacterium]